MSRQLRFWSRLWSATLVLQVCLGKSQRRRPQPPNIVFIIADQLRFDSSHSTPAHATPNLDALAKRGACFVSAYSSTPTCTPARAAMLSGQSPWNHGMLGYGVISQNYSQDLSHMLKDAGYETVAIGKNHFGWDENTQQGVAHGYESLYLYDGLSDFEDDYYKFFKSILPDEDPMGTGLHWNEWHSRPYVFDEVMHPTYWTGNRTVTYIDERNTTEKPLFLKVSFHRPHSPYDPPQRWLDKVNKSALLPPTTGGNWDSKYQSPQGCGTRDAWCGAQDPAAVMNTRAAYLANIMMVDEWIGRIIGSIKSKYPNTYFILTSDHGDMQGDHNMWRKGFAYEGSSHIPMIVDWPEDSAIPEDIRGVEISNVVELRDLMPTIAEIADLDRPSALREQDGKSMLCLLTTSCPWRTFLDLEHNTVYNDTVHWNALTDARQKYVFHANSGDEQLFDLIKDPGELYNMADSPQYKFELQLWRSRMVEQFRSERRGPEWVSNGKLQRRTTPQLYSPKYPR